MKIRSPWFGPVQRTVRQDEPRGLRLSVQVNPPKRIRVPGRTSRGESVLRPKIPPVQRYPRTIRPWRSSRKVVYELIPPLWQSSSAACDGGVGVEAKQ